MSDKTEFRNLREHHEKTVKRIRGLFPQIFTKEIQEEKKEETMYKAIDQVITLPSVIEVTESSLKDEIKEELRVEFESRLNEIEEDLIINISEYIKEQFQNYNITPKV